MDRKLTQAVPKDPDYSHSLTPTDTLLSRFSALTFNGHRIHLDRDYARNVEGFQNIIVHGPLSLTLMLKFLGTHLESHPDGPYEIERIEYTCIQPLFCDEELRLCAKDVTTPDPKKHRKSFKVWIESKLGGLSFRGTVTAIPRIPTTTASPEAEQNIQNSLAPSNTEPDWESPNTLRHTQGDQETFPAPPIMPQDFENFALLQKLLRKSDTSTPPKEPEFNPPPNVEPPQTPPFIRQVKTSHRLKNSRKPPHGTTPVIRSIPTDLASDLAHRQKPLRRAKPITIRYHKVKSVGQGSETPRKSAPRDENTPLIRSILLAPRIGRGTKRSRLRRIRVYPLSIMRFHYRDLLPNSKFRRRGVRRISSNKVEVRMVYGEGVEDHPRAIYGRFNREGIRGVGRFRK